MLFLCLTTTAFEHILRRSSQMGADVKVKVSQCFFNNFCWSTLVILIHEDLCEPVILHKDCSHFVFSASS